ncbi:MAG TPA: helix-turn-helix transcriptional regulator [Stellaceae bacterium]
MRREDPELTKRLSEIRATLDVEEEAPIPSDALERRPALRVLRDELRAIAHDESAPSRNRHYALLLLSLAYGDEESGAVLDENNARFELGFALGARSNVAPRLPPHLTLLPRYDVQAGAGAGVVVHAEPIVDFIAFDTSWLRQTLNVDPKRAAVITAIGDSMYPTIASGDLLIVDLSVDRVLDNAIYALRFGDALSVKRVQLRPSGGLRIISDNTKYAPDELGPDAVADLHVIGRIIWHGGVM